MYGLRFTRDSGGASFREWQYQQYMDSLNDEECDDPIVDEEDDDE